MKLNRPVPQRGRHHRHAARDLRPAAPRRARSVFVRFLVLNALTGGFLIATNPKFRIPRSGSGRQDGYLAEWNGSANDYAAGGAMRMPRRSKTRCWSGVGLASLLNAGTVLLAD